MSKPKITLFIDIRSGFTYIAFTVINNSTVFRDCEITYIPVDLRVIFKECGNVSAWGMKNKPDWVRRSAGLWARKFNVPLVGPPEGFMQASTTSVQQALCAVSTSCPERLTDVISALENAFWVGQKPLFGRDEFQPVFEQVLGTELGQKVATMGETSEMKDLLVSNTQLCIKEGGFGLPWYIATNLSGEKEAFFGFDHLGHAVEFLGLERPTPGSMEEGGWKNLM